MERDTLPCCVVAKGTKSQDVRELVREEVKRESGEFVGELSLPMRKWRLLV